MASRARGEGGGDGGVWNRRGREGARARYNTASKKHDHFPFHSTEQGLLYHLHLLSPHFNVVSPLSLFF